MERQALFDALSEFLIVEQGGLQLYAVALSRASDPELKDRYETFLAETANHREVLIRLIEALGGNPDYVSPTARIAQYKASSLLGAATKADGLSPQELELNDLENVLLAETKDQADWELLLELSVSLDDSDAQQAIAEAVAKVAAEEDEHLLWARETLARKRLSAISDGPAPDPARWQALISGPVPPVEEIHPAPIEEGLMEGSSQPQWIPSLVSRSVSRG